MKWPAGLVVSLTHEHAIIQKKPMPQCFNKGKYIKKKTIKPLGATQCLHLNWTGCPGAQENSDMEIPASNKHLTILLCGPIFF